MSNMEKNVFILHLSPSFSGGVGVFTSNLINYQLTQGYKVGVGTFNNGDIDDLNFLESLNKSVLTFVKKTKWFNKRPMLTGVPFKGMIRDIRNKYKGIKIIIHAHNPVALGLLQPLDNQRIVCTLHGRNVINSRLSITATNIIINKLINSGCKVVGVSKDTSNFYIKQCGNKKIITIYNGINIVNFKDNKEQKYFIIGFVSRIVDGKGWEVLLEAVQILNNKYPNKFRLIIAGEGDRVDRLNNLIDNYNISDIVDYKGFVKEAGNNIIPILDALVLPSNSEGLPISILEAFAHSVPVLATPVGGIPEIIKNGYNGIIISTNALDIAKKLENLYENKELYDLIKSNGYISYKENFTLAKMADKYERIYSELVCNGVSYEE